VVLCDRSKLRSGPVWFLVLWTRPQCTSLDPNSSSPISATCVGLGAEGWVPQPGALSCSGFLLGNGFTTVTFVFRTGAGAGAGAIADLSLARAPDADVMAIAIADVEAIAVAVLFSGAIAAMPFFASNIVIALRWPSTNSLSPALSDFAQATTNPHKNVSAQKTFCMAPVRISFWHVNNFSTLCKFHPESMPMTYQWPILLLHHSLDVAGVESSADCILNLADLAEDLLRSSVHVSAWGVQISIRLDIDVKVKQANSTITCDDQQTTFQYT
jgi:hypothetical protein